MTRRTKVRQADPTAATTYLKKALEFRQAMNRALAENEANAAALNAVHCAISAIDAVCARVGGKRSSGKDHGDAVRLLVEMFPTEEGRRQADRLGTILAKKNQVEYEERLVSLEESLNLAKQTERLLEWVRRFV